MEFSTIFRYFFIAKIISLVLLIIKHFFINRPKTPLTRDMSGKIVVTTGCSAGIGKETAKELLKSGATVVWACRDEKKTIKLIKEVSKSESKGKSVFIRLDLCSLESVYDFYLQFKANFDKLDILINNAGAATHEFYKTEDGLESIFQINHLSHTFLTALLLDFLSKSDDGRILVLSSEAHKYGKIDEKYLKFSKENFSFWSSYSNSKLANVYMGFALKRYCDSNNLNIKTVIIHPGAVATNISKPENKPWYLKLFIYLIMYPIMYFFFKSNLIGAQTTLHACYLERSKLKDGCYYADCEESKYGSTATNKIYEARINKFTKEFLQNHRIYNMVENNKNYKKFVDNLHFSDY
jgi:retinol dehydrogenase-12